MLFCGLTDDLDGYIARKYKMQSKLGKYLDFISDFSMFCMMLYCAYFYNKSLMTQYIGGILLIWCLYRIKEGNKNSLGLYTSNILNIFKNDFVMYFCLLSVVILIS